MVGWAAVASRQRSSSTLLYFNRQYFIIGVLSRPLQQLQQYNLIF